ncbi:MAG: hypothetical protein AAB767_02910 [Patescibacteria group bacterium]
MVLTDSAPVANGPLPVYLFTETPDNQESVLKRASILHHRGRASHVLLIDNLGGSRPGYPGCPPWEKRLGELRIPSQKIVTIPFTAPVLHTLSEACAMVEFAKKNGWNAVTIVFPPFHGSRCFLSAITAVRHLNPGMLVYCEVGTTEPWHGHAVHSQNVVQGLRKDLVVGELRRIKRYQRKNVFLRLLTDGVLFLKASLRDGTLFQKLRNIRHYAKQGSPMPLCSTEDALAYLEWRDTTK